MATFVKVSAKHSLRSDAGISLLRAMRDGMPAEINDGLRSYDDQVRMFLDNYTPTKAASAGFDPRPWRGTTYWRKQGNTVAVAVPGTSNHGDGTAVDLGHNARAWMRRHGAYYGWFNPDWAKNLTTFEPWHWEYNGSKDKSKNTTREDDMPKTRYGNRDLDQTLVPNRWNTLKVTDKGGVSVAFGALVYDTNVAIAFDAPSGTQVRARFYKVDYATGKRTYTYDRESKVDSPVTRGSTMRFVMAFKGECKPTERVRVEVYTWEKGVKTTSAAYRTHEW